MTPEYVLNIVKWKEQYQGKDFYTAQAHKEDCNGLTSVRIQPEHYVLIYTKNGDKLYALREEHTDIIPGTD